MFVDPDADMEEIGLTTTTTSPDEPMDMDEGRPIGCGSAEDPIVIDSDDDVPPVVQNGIHVVGDGSAAYPIELDSDVNVAWDAEASDEDDVFMPSSIEFSRCSHKAVGLSQNVGSPIAGISNPNGCTKICFQRQLLFGRKREFGTSHPRTEEKSWRTSNLGRDCVVGKCLLDLSPQISLFIFI